MTILRSLLYHVLFLTWTLVLAILFLPLLLGSRRVMQQGAAFWLDGALVLQRYVLGLGFECRGRIPTGPAIVAAKHQSAWETMVFHHLLDDPAFVLKKELLSLPFVGWYMTKSGQVAIDREGGARALKQMVEHARRTVGDNRQVVIFPEGHRQPPGRAGDYHTGVAMLRSALGVPVIPVAVNSGLYWGRNAFLRRSGTVIIEFLPPLAPDMDRKAFMTELERSIETATRALEAEAMLRHPGLRPAGKL